MVSFGSLILKKRTDSKSIPSTPTTLESSAIQVSIIEGKELPGNIQSDTHEYICDPFVYVYVIDRNSNIVNEFYTDVVFQSNTPDFIEGFSTDVPNLSDCTVVIEVFNDISDYTSDGQVEENRVSLGKAFIPGRSFESHVQSVWLTLQPNKGELLVQFHLIMDNVLE
jgi:hypothetical protein